MDVAAAAVHVPAMHFSLPASSRLHPLRLLPTGASSSLLTSTCAAISRGLPVHHGLGRTAVLVGRRVFPRFWSVVITNPKDPFLAARNLGSTAAVASASGAASSASGSRNANVVRRWRPSTVVAGVGDLEGESSAAAKSQRSGEREEDSLHTSSQEKKRERYSKADKAARSNSVTAAAGKGGGAFNKFRSKYQASGIGQTKSYSSSTCSTQQRSSGGGRRTYVSGSKFLSSGTHAKHISSDEKNGAVSFHKRKKVVAFSSHWQVGIGSQFLLGMPGAHVQSMPFMMLSKISEHVCDCTVSYTLLDDTEAGQCCGLLQ
jgi:hypothetical protein